MTNRSVSHLTSVIVLSAVLGATATPAFASTNDDIAACRAALSEAGTLDMDQYRLRFDSKKGSSTKTYRLDAINEAGGENKEVTCKVKRGKVLEAALVEDK